jgi:hypothetical protein
VRLDGDFQATKLAIPMALEADVVKNESGKTLNRVQNGLNLQLNSWSPFRLFALPLNSQITRTVGDQLFLLPPWTTSRRLWAGAASGGDGLPNSSSRRRRSLRVTDSPAPAHRRARDAGTAITKICQKKLAETRNQPKITHRLCHRPAENKRDFCGLLSLLFLFVCRSFRVSKPFRKERTSRAEHCPSSLSVFLGFPTLPPQAV